MLFRSSRKVNPISYTSFATFPLACPSAVTSTQCAAANGFFSSQLGAFPRFADQDVGFGKLDYQLNNANHLSASLNIDDFNEEFGVSLPAEDYHTVGGFVFGELGRPAEPGDEVSHDGIVFRVDAVEGQRIDRLTVTFGWRHPPQAEEGNPVPPPG